MSGAWGASPKAKKRAAPSKSPVTLPFFSHWTHLRVTFCVFVESKPAFDFLHARSYSFRGPSLPLQLIIIIHVFNGLACLDLLLKFKIYIKNLVKYVIIFAVRSVKCHFLLQPTWYAILWRTWRSFTFMKLGMCWLGQTVLPHFLSHLHPRWRLVNTINGLDWWSKPRVDRVWLSD